ncbi:hypothetical protein [Phenylobacterium sp.]|jgi:hypothetical protein|uniref:hypothetical protein n=1 Tax=Phenylobacterium sp. TaxID=1871053 RepID=UPI002F95D0FF
MAMDSAGRTYVTRTIIFMAVYSALNVGVLLDVFDSVEPPGTWLLALAVSINIAGQIWATLAFIRDSDEFVRALTAKRFIVAAGLTFTLATFWGFLELYAGAPHVTGAMVYPLFWMAYGLVTPLIRTSRA